MTIACPEAVCLRCQSDLEKTSGRSITAAPACWLGMLLLLFPSNIPPLNQADVSVLCAGWCLVAAGFLIMLSRAALDQRTVWRAIGPEAELAPGSAARCATWFRYDAKTGAITTPVTLALYPSLFRFGGATASDRAAALAKAIDRLIRERLHARRERDPPLIGDTEVALDMKPSSSGEAPAAVNGVAQIPAEPDGGLSPCPKAPIERIAQNVLDCRAATRAGGLDSIARDGGGGTCPPNARPPRDGAADRCQQHRYPRGRSLDGAGPRHDPARS